MGTLVLRLSGLVLALAAAPALAGDVSLQLDSGAGFSIRNSTGAIERLRVDEATGNVSRNGALFVHTTGTNGTFVGVDAGNLSVTGTDNTALGAHALASDGTGYANTAIGSEALRYTTTGMLNSAVGSLALRLNTTGFSNSAVGQGALAFNDTGSRNSALGVGALGSNITGSRNTAVGYNALVSSTIASGNSAFGIGALRNDTTGSLNAAFGHYALSLNTTAFGNSAFGYGALYVNTTGNSNSALGLYALTSNSSGFGNTAVGDSAMFANSTGDQNTSLGGMALRNNALGDRNVAIGYAAGISATGSNNIYLANSGLAGENGQIKIGASPVHTRAFIAGIRGVTTINANAIPVLIDSAGQLGTISSSREAKREIREMGDATARLLELRPVTFRYREQRQILPGGGEAPPEYGLIAEEVAEIFPDLVVYDDAGKPFTVRYHELAPMLLNEMKRQQQTIDALTTRLVRLERGDAAAR